MEEENTPLRPLQAESTGEGVEETGGQASPEWENGGWTSVYGSEEDIGFQGSFSACMVGETATYEAVCRYGAEGAETVFARVLVRPAGSIIRQDAGCVEWNGGQWTFRFKGDAEQLAAVSVEFARLVGQAQAKAATRAVQAAAAAASLSAK